MLKCFSSFALKVISGAEWGNLLLWEGGLIKVELCRAGHKPCHSGPITQLVLDEGELTTVGQDGFIRVSSFALPLGVHIFGQEVELIYRGIFPLQLLYENVFCSKKKKKVRHVSSVNI